MENEKKIVEFAEANGFTVDDLAKAQWIMKRKSLSFLDNAYNVQRFYENTKNLEDLLKLQKHLESSIFTLIIGNSDGENFSDKYYSRGFSTKEEIEGYLSISPEFPELNEVYLIKDRQIITCSMIVEKKVRLFIK